MSPKFNFGPEARVRFDAARDQYHAATERSAAWHPEGTEERIAADLRQRRADRAAREALTKAHRAYLRVLRAASVLHPTDETIRDVIRVWATTTPRWSPGGVSLTERDLASAHGGRFATEVARKDAAVASWRVWCDSSPRG